MDTLSYKTISANAKTVDKQWVVVDAEGKTLGRFCSEVAKVLRGKNKTSFTPHVDCGDNVIVLNAEKITMTGNKMNVKEYQNFSGYPGGRRVEIAKDLLAEYLAPMANQNLTETEARQILEYFRTKKAK